MCSAGNPSTSEKSLELQLRLRLIEEFDPRTGRPRDFIHLCARFCDLLDESAIDDLRAKSACFDALIGPESAFDLARRQLKPENKLLDLPTCVEVPSAEVGEHHGYADKFSDFVRAAEDRLRPRYTIDPCPSLPSQQETSDFLTFLTEVGARSINDTEWIRLNLQSLATITEWFRNQQEWKLDPPELDEAVRQFAQETWDAWRQSDKEHLLAAHLLLECQSAVNAGLAECTALATLLTDLESHHRRVIELGELLYTAAAAGLHHRSPPSNLDDYALLSVLAGTQSMSLKAAKSFLERHPDIRTHKPSPQRLLVHVGDWCKEHFKERGSQPTDEQIAAFLGVVETEKRKLQEGKRRSEP